MKCFSPEDNALISKEAPNLLEKEVVVEQSILNQSILKT